MTVVLAHPLTEAARLGLAPAFVGLLAVVLTVGVARLASSRGGRRRARTTGRARSLPLQPVGRALGLALLVLAVVAGRLGSAEQIDNPAPALVIGVGWPALLLGSALLGPIWDWLNPFDTLARGGERLAGQSGGSPADPRGLWLAAAAGAVGWTWWLAGYIPGGLEPRAIGLALGAYALVTVAGCLWVGREAWLGQAEVLTVTCRAITAARTPRRSGAAPAHLPVMGLLVGGLAFAELRFSSWYLADLAAVGVHDSFAAPVVLTGFAVACAVGLLTTVGAARWARRVGSADVLGIAVPWMVVGLGLSAALERDRLWNAAQLLVVQLSDPLGRGWDLLGTASRVVAPWHHGDVVRLWIQVGVLTGAALVGLTIGLRRARGGGADPAVVHVGAWLAVAVLSAASM